MKELRFRIIILRNYTLFVLTLSYLQRSDNKEVTAQLEGLQQVKSSPHSQMLRSKILLHLKRQHSNKQSDYRSQRKEN